MNKKRISEYRNRTKFKGFTLVEVLITVAITAIIMGVIATLFYSGATTYSSGSRKAFVQNDTRLGMEMLQNEVRYAIKLNIRPSGFDPESDAPETDLSYISYEEIENNIGKIVIYRNTGDGFDTMTLPGKYSGDSFFRMASNDTENGKIILELHLKGLYEGSELSLTTSINLLNMSASGTGINHEEDTPLDKSRVIEYLK